MRRVSRARSASMDEGTVMSRNNGLTVNLALRIGLAIGSVFAGSLASVTSGQNLSTGTVVITNNSAYGPILTDLDGLTLYTWAGDEPGASHCYDECATSWPPLLVSGAPITPDQLPGILGVTTRADGTVQATYNTMPLYHSDDDSPGDVYG